MLFYLHRLSQKIRYNNIFRLLFDLLGKIGIKISPFYLVVEGLSRDIPEFESDLFKSYKFEYFDSKDIAAIAALKERYFKEEELLKRLENGSKCLGLKKDGEIAAFTWFNLNQCPYGGYSFILKENEAYLFDAYTLLKYRGMKIAPFIRYQCYKELKKQSRTTLYSISEMLNKQSINFKKKLGARFVLMGIYIRFFNKWKFSFPVRHLIPQEEYGNNKGAR